MRTVSALGTGSRQGQREVQRVRGPPIPRPETQENGVRHERGSGGRATGRQLPAPLNDDMPDITQIYRYVSTDVMHVYVCPSRSI